MGNSGSGKTYLANQLANLYSLKTTSIDDLFLASDSFTKRRPENKVLTKLKVISSSGNWIIEGGTESTLQTLFRGRTC